MRRSSDVWNGFCVIVVPLNHPENASVKKLKRSKVRSELSKDALMISSFNWPTPKQRTSSCNNKSLRLLAT
jgi:hypothetical protein